MDLQQAIDTVAQGKDLSRNEAASVMEGLMKGQGTDAQIGGLLIALRMKGETVEEITGFASAMRAMATGITTFRKPLVDTCGTGGDGSGTFNISTAAAFVVAGAGVAVAKHGNRSASSQCGSADVLEALGVNLDASPESVGRCIDEIGIGFLYARNLHGAMKHVAGPRGELKTRTIFNLLGPLTNPAGATGQVVGVYDSRRVGDLARVLSKLGSEHAFVVAGCDGLDEITLAGPTVIAEAKGGAVSEYEVSPEDLGMARCESSELKGGGAETNASILRKVLEGEAGPRRDIVVMNASAALRAGGAAQDWKEGVALAIESVDSGAAKEKLDSLVEFSNRTARSS